MSSSTDDWLEKKKKELAAINGLDPVEELLTQMGVMKDSHDYAIAAMKRAAEECERLRAKCERLEVDLFQLSGGRPPQN